ncbi:MAG TPA: hypothetical protein VIU12_05470 [Chryseolinea sp.]
MKTVKKIGIWMDHQSAHLIEFTTDPMVTKTIESKFTHAVKEGSLHKGENGMHNKEQHQQAEYFKALGDTIKQYDSILLFGPTDAKTELFNLLTANHLFAKIEIKVRQSDKMTENQEHAFVKEYFSGSPKAQG